jgi:hypothetical protein
MLIVAVELIESIDSYDRTALEHRQTFRLKYDYHAPTLLLALVLTAGKWGSFETKLRSAHTPWNNTWAVSQYP